MPQTWGEDDLHPISEVWKHKKNKNPSDTYILISPGIENDPISFFLGQVVDARGDNANIVFELMVHWIEVYKGTDP